MTVFAVLIDPPRPGLVLPELPASSPLADSDVADLYAAMVKDTFTAVERSGGELLVNYRPTELLPEAFRDDESVETEVRSLVAQALDDPDRPRYEVQVGSSFAARAGNTATHLLEEEDETSVAILDGTAPLVGRTHLDSAAMKLRTSELVLGPADGGRVYYLGLTEPIDFTDAYAPPALETLTERGVAADLGIDFLPSLTTVETGPDLASLVTMLRARRMAGRQVPAFTTDVVDRLDLSVSIVDGQPAVVR
ncbi:MAG: hypothetical protein ABEH65_00300 [Halobacteriales archaeon]